jgi:Zn-dependent protease
VADAEAAEAGGDLLAALAAWRAARELLPPASTQHAYLTGKVQRLSRAVEAPAAGAPAGAVAAPGAAAALPRRDARWAGAVGPLAALAFKLKFVATFLVANAKFLILAFAKGGALLPALVSFAAFGTGFGWRIAGGLLASLYVHELGHVAWSRRYGIPVTPPMFVPGVGAFVRLRHRPVDAHEDARIGLAGPAWGLAAAVVALVPALALGWSTLRAVAWWGAVINLLNLVPFASLDGGRAFRALSRRQRGWVATAFAIAWLARGGWPCALLAACAGVRAADREAPNEPDRAVLNSYLLVGGLLALTAVLAAPAGGGAAGWAGSP